MSDLHPDGQCDICGHGRLPNGYCPNPDCGLPEGERAPFVPVGPEYVAPDDEPDGPEYGLLMPFVVVASAGGPFADAPYAAGWEMGKLGAVLAQCAFFGWPPDRQAILASNVKQAELIAMNYGFTMTVHPWAEEVPEEAAAEWADVSFSFAALTAPDSPAELTEGGE